MQLNPLGDGLTHINIYSRGQTELGQMLSNFYRYPISTLDGGFMSVEGYWYWLGIEECLEKEKLRTESGVYAKNLGRAILQLKGKRFDDDFERKILKAIWYKFKRNPHMLIESYRNLPLEHYYVFDGKVKDVKRKYLWMIDGISKMRDHILSNSK